MCRYESLVVVAIVALVFWTISSLSQRWNPYAPRIKISWLLAVLAGSKDDMVMWRTFTIQVGIVVYLATYTILLLIWCIDSLLPPSIVGALVTLILQMRQKG